MTESPPTKKKDLRDPTRIKKFQEPADGTLGARILRYLREIRDIRNSGDSDEEIARACQTSSEAVRKRRVELCQAELVFCDRNASLINESGKKASIWIARTPNEIKAMQTQEVEEKKKPLVVSQVKHDPANVVLKLAHCGEIMVTNDEIVGWFHPIPMALWSQIIGFHRTMAKETRSETVSYHRFNPKSGGYDTIIPHQVTSKNGLHVHTPWNSAKNKALLDAYSDRHQTEFFPANTIHTHVDVSAFESGTDAGDEQDLPGWHITLGKLISALDYDIHARFRLPNTPKVRKFTSANKGYVIPAKLLFERKTDPKEITRHPDTNTDWHRFKDRVRFH